jgi:hypothetical protein
MCGAVPHLSRRARRRGGTPSGPRARGRLWPRPRQRVPRAVDRVIARSPGSTSTPARLRWPHTLAVTCRPASRASRVPPVAGRRRSRRSLGRHRDRRRVCTSLDKAGEFALLDACVARSARRRRARREGNRCRSPMEASGWPARKRWSRRRSCASPRARRSPFTPHRPRSPTIYERWVST